MTHSSLLDELLSLAGTHSSRAWFQKNARSYLEVCDLYAQTARQHHDGLVKRFIELPATQLTGQSLDAVTSSGPPLSVLLRALETLRDLRVAAPRKDIATRHDDVARLRALLTTTNAR
jgi:hypothetical protein